jgi:hypothetical protein
MPAKPYKIYKLRNKTTGLFYNGLSWGRLPIWSTRGRIFVDPRYIKSSAGQAKPSSMMSWPDDPMELVEYDLIEVSREDWKR